MSGQMSKDQKDQITANWQSTTDAIEALFTKQSPGDLDDPRPVLRRLLPAHFHVTAPFAP